MITRNKRVRGFSFPEIGVWSYLLGGHFPLRSGCIMHGNFAPMRVWLCALWREGGGCSGATNRTGLKKKTSVSNITCGGKRCFLPLDPPPPSWWFWKRTPSSAAVCVITCVSRRQSWSVSRSQEKGGGVSPWTAFGAQSNNNGLRLRRGKSCSERRGTHSWDCSVLHPGDIRAV